MSPGTAREIGAIPLKKASALHVGRFSLGMAALLAANITALLLPTLPLCAASPRLLATGNLLGSVVNAEGTAEMGAVVQLLNRYDRVVAKTMSGADGRFAFVALPNDVYSIRVSLPSFLPAVKNKILIEGGVDSLLQIHLATLFSSVEVTYGLPTSAMSDEWKWVLRSSPSTRPINRYASVSDEDVELPVFSQTHALLAVTGGDGGPIDAAGALADLGTGFALSTNILGRNQLRLSGAVGENNSAGPMQMAVEATYSRSPSPSGLSVPEVTLAVTQLAGFAALAPANPGFGGSFAGSNVLRAMSLSFYNTAEILDGVHLEYGAKGESVDYQQHAARLSPYARLTVDAGRSGEFLAAWTSGARPDDLLRHQAGGPDAFIGSDAPDDLSGAMTGVGRLPAISERNGSLRLQRTQNVEVGWQHRSGDTTLAATAFSEQVTDGRLNVAGDASGFAPGNILSDSWSTTSVANVGDYKRTGYLLSSTTKLSDVLELALAYGGLGGFARSTAATADQFGLVRSTSQLAVVNAKTRLPATGTQLTVAYGWTESGIAVPRHNFVTQNIYLAPGLNISFRQPLPSIAGMPGRLELTGTLQNLLAQGYLPLDAASGRTITIAESPRVIRGGLNFIF